MSITKDIMMVLLVGGLILRYLPQIYFNIINKKNEIIVHYNSIAKAWYILLFYSMTLGILLYEMLSNRLLGQFAIVGMIVYYFGIIISLLGLFAIRKQYSESLIRYRNQKLVTNGVYSIIRHPMRVGLLIEVTGIGLMSNRIYAIIPIIMIMVVQYIRTLDEENMLTEFFGDKEKVYIYITPRFNLLKGIYIYINNRFIN